MPTTQAKFKDARKHPREGTVAQSLLTLLSMGHYIKILPPRSRDSRRMCTKAIRELQSLGWEIESVSVADPFRFDDDVYRLKTRFSDQRTSARRPVIVLPLLDDAWCLDGDAVHALSRPTRA